jgi:hypothetical protein
MLKADAPILGPYPTIIGKIGIPCDMDGRNVSGLGMWRALLLKPATLTRFFDQSDRKDTGRMEMGTYITCMLLT